MPDRVNYTFDLVADLCDATEPDVAETPHDSGNEKDSGILVQRQFSWNRFW